MTNLGSEALTESEADVQRQERIVRVCDCYDLE